MHASVVQVTCSVRLIKGWCSLSKEAMLAVAATSSAKSVVLALAITRTQRKDLM